VIIRAAAGVVNENKTAYILYTKKNDIICAELGLAKLYKGAYNDRRKAEGCTLL
jgi:hypothetical protein